MKAKPYYVNQARKLIKDAREDRDITYNQLGVMLRDHGEYVATRTLINKINRGKFSMEFALKCLAAMDVTSVKVANYLVYKHKSEPDGRTTQTIANPSFEWPDVTDDDNQHR